MANLHIYRNTCLKKETRKYHQTFHRTKCWNIPNTDKFWSQQNMIFFCEKNPVTSSSLTSLMMYLLSFFFHQFLNLLPFNWPTFNFLSFLCKMFRIYSFASHNSYPSSISTPFSLCSHPSLIPFSGKRSQSRHDVSFYLGVFWLFFFQFSLPLWLLAHSRSAMCLPKRKNGHPPWTNAVQSE